MTQYDNNLVVISNTLMRYGVNSMAVWQQKCLCYFISNIKRNDNLNQEYYYSISELSDLLDIDGGHNIEALKQSLIDMQRIVWYLTETDESNNTIAYRSYTWFDHIDILPNQNMICLQWHHRITPYLFNLQGLFCQYNLKYVLQMKSKHTISLYHLLRSYLYRDKEENVVSLPIDHIKEQMLCQSYTTKNFLNLVLKPSQDELNRKADIEIETKKIKHGTRITDIEFVIKEQKDIF